MATISPPNPNIALEDGATGDDDWTEDEDDRCLQTHGISPNHLFAKDATDVPEKLMETLDLTWENSPFKKKSKNTNSSLKPKTRYSTSAFSLTQKVHVHTYAKTFIEAAITVKSEDKPKELIGAIKLLLANGKYLDSNLALSPLKHNINITKPKLILREDDVPVNFTHLGQYVYTSGNRIFEKKKNWKAAPNKTAPQRDQEQCDENHLKDPVVYFTFAIATDVLPHTLINGIKTEWETHGGGKLQVKDLQSQESKVVLALYYIYTGTPYNIILKTIQMILRDTSSTREHERMTLEDDDTYNPLPVPEVSLHSQVPRLKGVDSSSFDKLPYHVRENRKVLHIETDPDDEAHLKDLIRFAKERNFIGLFLGKHAHVTEVMDNNSTPGEVKRMVKFAMGHANYQGSMTGETISGIDLLDGAVALTVGNGSVSLRQVLFTYFKMKDKYSVFAELHHTEEMGPVLAIIPACAEAERLVQMMNKQVAAFLYYFLLDASLPDVFIKVLLKETCDPALVKEISDCDWDSDTETLTTPEEKKQDEALDDLEGTSLYKNAFDLQELGIKTPKTTADKNPKALFDLDQMHSATQLSTTVTSSPPTM